MLFKSLTSNLYSFLPANEFSTLTRPGFWLLQSSLHLRPRGHCLSFSLLLLLLFHLLFFLIQLQLFWSSPKKIRPSVTPQAPVGFVGRSLLPMYVFHVTILKSQAAEKPDMMTTVTLGPGLGSPGWEESPVITKGCIQNSDLNSLPFQNYYKWTLVWESWYHMQKKSQLWDNLGNSIFQFQKNASFSWRSCSRIPLMPFILPLMLWTY